MAEYNLDEVTETGELASLETFLCDESKEDFARADLPRA